MYILPIRGLIFKHKRRLTHGKEKNVCLIQPHKMDSLYGNLTAKPPNTDVQWAKHSKLVRIYSCRS